MRYGATGATLSGPVGAWTRRRLHGIADKHPAHGVERTGYDLIAFLQSREHLEITLAGDAGLDDHERRLAVFHHEHAFGLFALFARLQLHRHRGRWRRLRRTELEPSSGRTLVVDDVALRVVEQLAHRHRLNRYGNHLFLH